LKRSIRVRVLISILAAVVPVLAASAWFLARAFEYRLLRDIDVALHEEAETVVGLVAAGISDESLRQLIVVIAAENDLGTPKYVAVMRRGRTLAEAPADAARLLASANPGRFRIARFQAADADEPVEVVIAVAESPPLLAHRRLTWLLWVGTPVVSLLLGLSVWASLGRALRPLERAADGLAGIGAGSLSSRLRVENPDDEVGRIVRAVNEMLERVEVAVGRLRRFTADAAHELRTPLTVLRTGLELASSKHRTTDESRAALREALQQTDRIHRLAEDLLTLARLDAAEGPQSTATVDVAEILHELADGWGDEAQARDIRIRLETERPLSVLGNGGDLYRLFNNLIENAVRHGVAGGEIRIRGETRDGQIRINLMDDGPGIAAEDLDRIFDRFYRAPINAAAEPGSGLGLSIAREIVRNHGGRLTAQNRGDGKAGSVFVVSLPRAE
jgi:signal transduction histidine kinase